MMLLDPPSAQSSHHMVKDTMTARKRDTAVEDTARPSSAQSARSSTRDIKTTKKRDPDADDAVRPPSAQSNNAVGRRDVEAQHGTRPMSGQLNPNTYERKFHILSSAPVRPQRGFVDLKRVAPKHAVTLQQNADTEVMNLLQLDDVTMKKQMDKTIHDLEEVALQPSSSRSEVPQSEIDINNEPPFEQGQDQPQDLVKDAAPSAAADKKPVTAGTRNRSITTNVPPVFGPAPLSH